MAKITGPWGQRIDPDPAIQAEITAAAALVDRSLPVPDVFRWDPVGDDRRVHIVKTYDTLFGLSRFFRFWFITLAHLVCLYVNIPDPATETNRYLFMGYVALLALDRWIFFKQEERVCCIDRLQPRDGPFYLGSFFSKKMAIIGFVLGVLLAVYPWVLFRVAYDTTIPARLIVFAFGLTALGILFSLTAAMTGIIGKEPRLAEQLLLKWTHRYMVSQAGSVASFQVLSLPERMQQLVAFVTGPADESLSLGDRVLLTRKVRDYVECLMTDSSRVGDDWNYRKAIHLWDMWAGPQEVVDE